MHIQNTHTFLKKIWGKVQKMFRVGIKARVGRVSGNINNFLHLSAISIVCYWRDHPVYELHVYALKLIVRVRGYTL